MGCRERRHRGGALSRRRAAALSCALLVTAGLVGPATAAGADRVPDISTAGVRAKQWWISRLGLERVWKLSTGRGVTVAVLDEGVDPGFGGRPGDLTGAALPGFAAAGSRGNPRVDSSPNHHGSQMATLIAGRGTGFGVTGVARGAKILPVHMPNTQPETIAAVLDRLAALPSPPAVVNMSLGNPGPCDPQLQQAVRRAVDKGLILVASAGNDPQPASLAPADCTGVLSVGALRNTDPPKVWPRSHQDRYVSLTAPGVDMITYGPDDPLGYGYASGTSEATALVSGTLAVVRAKFPTESSRRIVTRVLATARQFQGAQGTRNDAYGYGVALPEKALTVGVPANAANPVYDALDALPSSSTPSSSTPSSPSSGASAPATPDVRTADPAEDGSTTPIGLIVGLVGGIVLVVLVVVLLLRRRGRPTPSGPSPWGGPH